MSLSVWSEEKNCFVLAPMKKEVINAFHPMYVKTHEPDLMKHFRLASAGKKASMTLSDHVEEMRKVDPAHGYLGISKTPREMKPPKMMKRPSLKPKEFHVYAKAGRKS